MSRPFGWCLVGASQIAEASLAPAIEAQPDGEIVGVVSGNAARGESLARDLDAKHYVDPEQALSDDAVDAVYISSINSAHYLQALGALQQGKHVLCEKPITLDLEEARTLVREADARGLVLATNHHMRNSVPHEQMRNRIAAGDIGAPVSSAVRHAIQLPATAQGWRTTDPSAGAGAIFDLVVHDIDALRFVLGQDPTSVFSYTDSGTMIASGIDETVLSLARMESGLTVHLHESFVSGHVPTLLAVYGTEGSLVGDGIQSMQPAGTLTHFVNGTRREIDLGDREDLYVAGVRRFQRAVRDGTQPAATGLDGAWSLAFALAALRSSQTGSEQAVPRP